MKLLIDGVVWIVNVGGLYSFIERVGVGLIWSLICMICPCTVLYYTSMSDLLPWGRSLIKSNTFVCLVRLTEGEDQMRT